MAGVKLDVKAGGSGVQIDAALDKVIAVMTDPQPMFADMGEYLLRSTRGRFTAQAAPDGTPWRRLSPITIGRKPKNKDRILVQEGYLRGPGMRYQALPDGFAVGSDRVYAAAHQLGMAKGYAGTTRRNSPIPWGDIPARPFLGLSADDETELLDIASDFMAGG